MKRVFLLFLLSLLASPFPGGKIYGEEGRSSALEKDTEAESQGREDDILSEAEGLFGEREEDEYTNGRAREQDIVSGYLETAFQLARDPAKSEQWHLGSANKLKIKLEKKIREIRVHGEVNFLYYSGYSRSNIIDYLPKDERASLEPFRDDFSFSYENRIEVVQAYTTFPIGVSSLTIGRQPLTLGTGYVWNPVDPFNMKDIREPTYEIEARDALKASILLPLNGEARVAAIVGDDLSRAGGFISAKVNALFDWELSFATIEQSYTDLLTPDTYWERDTTTGLAFSGQVGEVGVHGEIAYHFTSNPRSHFRWLIGGDYTFSFQNKIMAEIFGNEAGERKPERYSLEDWLGFISGERIGMGRNYLYASTSQTLFSIASVSLSALINATDSSFIAFPEGKLNLSELAEFRLVLYLPSGREGSEFGGFPPNAEMRITGYF